MKQKKQKFKSPPYASLSYKAIALQSEAAPRAVYILPLSELPLDTFTRQNLKGPCLCAQGHRMLPRFCLKLGVDKERAFLLNASKEEDLTVKSLLPLQATDAVKKKRGALMAPGQELALWAKAGIAINRPFGYFGAMPK